MCLGQIPGSMSAVGEGNCSKDWLLGTPVHRFQVMKSKQQRLRGSRHRVWKSPEYHVQKISTESFERKGWLRVANALIKPVRWRLSTEHWWLVYVQGWKESLILVSKGKQQGRNCRQTLNSSLHESRGMEWQKSR